MTDTEIAEAQARCEQFNYQPKWDDLEFREHLKSCAVDLPKALAEIRRLKSLLQASNVNLDGEP